jgi:hypothetical protein
MQLGGQSQDLSVVGVTMSSGQVTVPRTVMHPVLWAMPGVDVYWTAPDKYIPPLFTVTDLTGDVTNTYVQTSLAGGFPSVPNKSVINAIANTVNFSGCTGNTTVKDLSQAGARNARPFTYSNRIYTCTGNVAAIQAANPGVPVIDMNSLPNEIAPSGGPPGPGPLMSRAIVSLTANVSVADTGANGTVDFHIGGQFDNYPVYNGSGTGTTWAPTINLKKTGTRTYIGSGGTGTWSGTCLAGSPGNADSCPTLTNPSYFSNVMPPFTSVNLSGETAGQCPVVTVTIQTN